MENIKGSKVELENPENIKLTRHQKNQLIRIVKGHVEDKNYYFHHAKVHINKYFVSIYFCYAPIKCPENPYVTKFKDFWIGKKGAIKKADCKFGIGKNHNIRKIAEYYFKAEDG